MTLIVEDVERDTLARTVLVLAAAPGGTIRVTERLAGSRCIGTCRACGATTAAVVWRIARNNGRYLTPAADAFQDDARFDSRRGIVAGCRGCGAQVVVGEVVGRVRPDVACDARCTGAKGRRCDCSCGGLNHGADHGER